MIRRVVKATIVAFLFSFLFIGMMILKLKLS